VLRVRLSAEGQSVTVSGWCRYWIGADGAGGFACDEHPDIGGPVFYRWDGSRFVRETSPADGVTVERGSWVSDEQWRKGPA